MSGIEDVLDRLAYRARVGDRVTTKLGKTFVAIYDTVDAKTIPDAILAQHKLLVIRGDMLDGIFRDDEYGRHCVKTYQEKLDKKGKSKHW